MVRVTVLYASDPGRTCDHADDLTRHMPMVRDRLGRSGLVRAEVDTHIRPQVQVSEVVAS